MNSSQSIPLIKNELENNTEKDSGESNVTSG